MKTDLERRVISTLALALGPDLMVSIESARSNTPAWDSLKKVEIIFILEEEFDVQFTESELIELESVHSIVAILKDHGIT